MKKAIAAVLVLCLTFVLSACAPIQITEDNRTEKAIDTSFGVMTLFEEWTPLVFTEGQSFSYDFIINTGEYTSAGKFLLSVRGKAPSGLRFSWKFEIGSETLSGSCFGTSEKFYKKLSDFCKKDYILNTFFTSVFVVYEGSNTFNQLIGTYEDIPIGETWTRTSLGIEYEYSLDGINNYAGVDGITYTTRENGVPADVFCISPFIPLPSMTLYFVGENGYVFAQLNGAIF